MARHMDDDQITFEEAIDHIMRVTGRTRRQAKVELMHALAMGKIPVTGINSKTGRRETVPPEAFPKVQ